MQEQLSEAFLRVKSILSDVKKSIVSVSSPTMFLPQISDILSEIEVVVSSVHEADVDHAIQSDDELWWDSSPECVAYSDSDDDQSMMPTFVFSSVHNESLSSLPSISSEDQTKDFIDKILSLVSKAAPGDVFSRRKYERKRDRLMRSLVHPELFSMWQHSSQLYAEYKVDYVKSAPLYPTINLRDVNVRALANIPRPQPFRIFGCPSDPNHYKLEQHLSRGVGLGYLYGYDTIHGVVPVPDQPIHGYTWDHVKGDWILYSDVTTNRGRFTSRNQRG